MCWLSLSSPLEMTHKEIDDKMDKYDDADKDDRDKDDQVDKTNLSIRWWKW